MMKPDISANFTIDDIHKIREYNHAITKNMTSDERTTYYKNGAAKARKKIDEFRKQRIGLK